MTEPVEKKRRATYQDVIDAPPHVNAEIIDGELHLSRPGGPATAVAANVIGDLQPAFSRGRGGPGGWLILAEPEIHIGDDIIDPDLAGWRRERLPLVPNGAFFSVVPDWVCEVLSPTTERFDRADKLPLYAAWGVRHSWLVHPRHRTLEVYRLDDGKWTLLGIHKDNARVRAEPFDAIEIDLSIWWSDIPLRASEPAAEYGTAL